MFGLAKQLFIERGGRKSWKERRPCRWPILSKALKAGCFSYVDYAFAEMFLENISNVDERTAAFLCHLSRSSREGHLCIKIEENKITPSPREMWFSENVEEGEINELRTLAENLSKGVSALPEQLLTDVKKEASTFPITPICRYGSLYYFQKNWVLESLFLDHFKRLLTSKPSLDINLEKAQQQIASLQGMNQLNQQQASAIQQALTHSFSVITGGPGTGKTYTAGHLIKLFWESLDEKQKEKCVIAIAAPTGKAASNLQRSLQRATADIEDYPPLQAKTLHSLLGIRRSTPLLDKPPPKLVADLILVDECSMIDVGIMAQLFASVKKGARLVLLGDPHQLPPVEAGSLFSDAVTVLKQNDDYSVHVTDLKTCLRVELQEMIDFATTINQGLASQALELLNQKKETSALKRLSFDLEKENWRALQDRLLSHAQTLFPSPRVVSNHPEEILEAYNQFRLLSPLRKGPFGVDEMNQRLFHKMVQKVRREEWFVSPIMVTSNDYKMELFNGEVGVLLRRRSHDLQIKEGDYAIFPANQGNSIRTIPAILLPKYEYAYCLSVHKSQGSEFDRVLLLLPEGSEVFGREVLYTAVTRARKKLEVWGPEDVLSQTLSKTSSRTSGITGRFCCKNEKLTTDTHR